MGGNLKARGKQAPHFLVWAIESETEKNYSGTSLELPYLVSA